MSDRRGNRAKKINNLVEPDEGWWASVLADEHVGKDAISANGSIHSTSPLPPSSVDWGCAKRIYEQDEIIHLRVYGYNRGGLLVQNNKIQGFVPISHMIDLPCGSNEDDRFVFLASYVGKPICLKIIECEPSQERIVFSERAALAGVGKRKQLFKALRSGILVVGIVTNVTDFGVFVDLGGVEGLIHVSELSWGRVQHPQEVLQIGQEVRALVLQVNEENSRVALSVKRLISNPWETLANRYKPGDVIMAKITDIIKYGAFAKLEDGIEGLIHISSLTLPGEDCSIAEILQPGQVVHVRILHIDVERRRLGLGLVTVE